MIDRETVERGLEMLAVAIAEILEDDQLEAVSRLPALPTDRMQVFASLEATGRDVAALALAANVLLRRSD